MKSDPTMSSEERKQEVEEILFDARQKGISYWKRPHLALKRTQIIDQNWLILIYLIIPDIHLLKVFSNFSGPSNDRETVSPVLLLLSPDKANRKFSKGLVVCVLGEPTV